MSKELTEQWRNGTLPLNHYYVERKTGSVFIDNTVVHFDERIPFTRLRWQEDIKEVLAPVPTYEEWKAAYECQLMESEEVLTLKQQLKEANEIIANFRTYDFTRDDELAEEYQVKYSISGNKIYTNRKSPKEFEYWRKKITKSLKKKLKSGVLNER